ncbi:hypothetical protein D3261_10440 [Halococcus sp. IIIV-5B]|nr:hypothetical protein D3261_10440 [Halococcus sp. IIIV-5B]
MHGQQSDIETFGNILGCSDYQIERAKWMWKQVDGVSLSGNFSIEEIALAFLSLAQGTDVHPRFPENPSDDILKEMADVRQQEIWDELIEVNDIDTEGAKPIRKLRGKYHGMV